MCYFMLGTLWKHMRLRSPNHRMTGLKLIPTQKRGSLPSTTWTTQEYGVDSPTSLYLCMDRKEANTIFIFSQLAASQFNQMKTALRFVHMEGGFVSTKGGRMGKTRMV